VKVTVLGSGTAFSLSTRKNGNASLLLEENGRRMLFDCGRTTPEQLDKINLTFRDIDDIYISHPHGDHIGGLEFAALMRYDWKNHPRNFADSKYAIRLIANSGLMTDLWNYSLRGGLSTFEGFVAQMGTCFEPVRIPDSKTFEWQGWTLLPIQQVHIMSGSSIAFAFGLVMKKEGHKTLYFVADSQHCSPRQMEMYYREADVIFQDCECSPFPTNVHATYKQLSGDLSANSPDIGAEVRGKMWLNHFQDFVLDNKDGLGNDFDWLAQAKKDGFAGFLLPGMVFEF
jgi:ribonuclease BN (tRNA processing enzyme)